jgi:hypothetical protein
MRAKSDEAFELGLRAMIAGIALKAPRRVTGAGQPRA